METGLTGRNGRYVPGLVVEVVENVEGTVPILNHNVADTVKDE